MTRTTERQKRAALDRELKAMFNRLEARSTPEHLAKFLDQLEAADRPPLKP